MLIFYMHAKCLDKLLVGKSFHKKNIQGMCVCHPHAGPVSVHADPEEIQYWKEVEAEELIVEAADSDEQEDEQQ